MTILLKLAILSRYNGRSQNIQSRPVRNKQPFRIRSRPHILGTRPDQAVALVLLQCVGNPADGATQGLRASGGILFLLRQHLGLALTKDDPLLRELQNWADAQFSAGRQTSIEWEELEPVVRADIEKIKAPDLPEALCA